MKMQTELQSCRAAGLLCGWILLIKGPCPVVLALFVSADKTDKKESIKYSPTPFTYVVYIHTHSTHRSKSRPSPSKPVSADHLFVRFPPVSVVFSSGSSSFSESELGTRGNEESGREGSIRYSAPLLGWTICFLFFFFFSFLFSFLFCLLLSLNHRSLHFPCALNSPAPLNGLRLTPPFWVVWFFLVPSNRMAKVPFWPPIAQNSTAPTSTNAP